jgi:hypothetical protein
MPGTANPDAPEFYTYRFFANDRTFYVGKGHWQAGEKVQRVSDRGIYASRLRRNRIERNIEHKDLKKKDIQILNLLHFKYKIEVRWEFLGKRDLVEAEAYVQEAKYIKEYLAEGCLLVNHHMNPEKHTVDQVIAWILSGDLTPSHVGEKLEFRD